MALSTRKPISRKVRFAVLAAGGFRCHYCGRRPPRAFLQVDHVVPVARGGSNHPRNLVPACQDCNGGKAADELTRVRWKAIHGACGRCGNAGPWEEYVTGPPESPGQDVVLVCGSCNFIIATREWVTS